jgi:GTPase SAR1 family protein
MSSSSSVTPLAAFYRIVFLGMSGVGKTSIVQWILNLSPPNEYLPTIGVNFYNLDTVAYDNQYYLQLCDVSGNEIYSNLISTFLKAASVTILVFHYQNKDSQLAIQRLYSTVSEYITPTKILIVGNNAKGGKKSVTKTLASWTKTHNLVIFPVSVQENIGKSRLIQEIIRITSDSSTLKA